MLGCNQRIQLPKSWFGYGHVREDPGGNTLKNLIIDFSALVLCQAGTVELKSGSGFAQGSSGAVEAFNGYCGPFLLFKLFVIPFISIYIFFYGPDYVLFIWPV